MYTSDQIRNKFLKYFELKGHKKIEGSSLVPYEDQTLLFVNAGMVQFKNIFLGLEKRNYTSATSSQKCLRITGKHNDFESVGKTSRHHTFFEMLGNFSFGNYFKENAIILAWEFLIKELNISKEKLWVSVYEKDKKTAEIWKKVTNINKNHIIFLNSENNFWSMGETGPCGPCTEIYYDYGKKKSCKKECKLSKCKCDRFLEIWNIVFMEFNRLENKNLIPLVSANVDTGMGLERIVSIMQNVKSNYDTDLFKPIINKIEELTNYKYRYKNIKFPFNVIADHIRAATFLIGDGILPSNEGRGYVLRKLLRRSARIGKTIGLNEFFLYKIVETVIHTMNKFYIELENKCDFIKKVIYSEEKRFSETIQEGLDIINQIIIKMKKEKRNIMLGEEAFMLYDTYGFPIELTKDILREQKLDLENEGFEKSMIKQKKLSKTNNKKNNFVEELNLDDIFKNLNYIEFLGYEKYKTEAKIIALCDEKGNKIDILQNDTKGILITNKTSFYPEGGGQVGDKGYGFLNKKQILIITDTKKNKLGEIYHIVKTNKDITTGDNIILVVDSEKRKNIERNHSSVHLLHHSLKTILGNHISQKGSYVSDNYLRFDFSHFESLTQNKIKEIECLVNDFILSANNIYYNVSSFYEAKKNGAISIFGEQYQDMVRTVKIDNVSMELCGGTHVKNTSHIGFFKIISESSIGSGLRRIEAITARKTLEYIYNKNIILEKLKNILKVSEKELIEKIFFLNKINKEQKFIISKLNKQFAENDINELNKNIIIINGISVFIKQFSDKTMNELNVLSDIYKNKLKSGIIGLGSNEGEKANLLLVATKDLINKIACDDLIKIIAPIIEGNGGGNKFRAQAGGKNKNKINKALNEVKILIKKYNGGNKNEFVR